MTPVDKKHINRYRRCKDTILAEKARLKLQAKKRAMKMQQWRRSVKLARSTRDKLKVELKATKAALKSAQDAHRNTLESLQMEKQISEGYKRTIDQMRLFKERNTGPIA